MDTKKEFINTSNLTEQQSNALKYAMKHINTNPVKVSTCYKGLKSWIKLVTINQIKIMMGNDLLKSFTEEELLNEGNNIAKELYIDSLIVAYQKNLYEGINIKDKVYYMLPTKQSYTTQIYARRRNLIRD